VRRTYDIFEMREGEPIWVMTMDGHNEAIVKALELSANSQKQKYYLNDYCYQNRMEILGVMRLSVFPTVCCVRNALVMAHSHYN